MFSPGLSVLLGAADFVDRVEAHSQFIFEANSAGRLWSRAGACAWEGVVKVKLVFPVNALEGRVCGFVPSLPWGRLLGLFWKRLGHFEIDQKSVSLRSSSSGIPSEACVGAADHL